MNCLHSPYADNEEPKTAEQLVHINDVYVKYAVQLKYAWRFLVAKHLEDSQSVQTVANLSNISVSIVTSFRFLIKTCFLLLSGQEMEK